MREQGYVRGKDIVGGILLERANNSVEEVDYVLMFLVRVAVASDIERGGTSRVLAELVSPELSVGTALVDPVRVH